MKWNIVFVPYPFDDLTRIKLRPALCLTNEIGPHRQILLAYITSVIPTSAEPWDILLDPSSPDMASCGLKVLSVLRLHRLITIRRSIISRVLGRVPASIQFESLRKLDLLFKR